MWPSDRRLTVHPSAPQAYQCLLSHFLTLFLLFHFLSYFGSPGESWLHINVVVNWQLSNQGIRWPVSPDRIVGSGVNPSRSSIFLKLSTDNLLVFKWSQAQFFKNPYQICCVYVTFAQHNYSFNFKLTSDAKIQPVFLKYRRGRPFLTMVTCWSCSTSNFYALIG